ncbi:MAG: LiaI-LiaF-like domain-containing protein [Limnochordia bacterium]
MRTGRMDLGAALVVFGLLLSMMNWGFLDRTLWWNLVRWWPAFLLAFGLHLALNRTRFWLLPTHLLC